MKWLRILGIFLPLILVAGAFAAQIKIVYAPSIVTPQELSENPLKFRVVVLPENETIKYATLTLTIYDKVNEEIYCQNSIQIDDLSEEKSYEFTVYSSSCYKQLGDGIYVAEFELKGYNDANDVLNLTDNIEFNIRSSLKDKEYDLDILSVIPDFTKLTEIAQGLYVVKVKVENSGLEDLSQVYVTLRVLDEYGRVLYERTSKSYDIDSGYSRTYELVLDATNLELWKTYIVQIEAKDIYGYAIESKEFSIRVVPGKVGDLSIIDVIKRPYTIYPGDYVELIVYIRNNMGRDLELKPIVLSKELNIYKELDYIQFTKGEIKKIPIVIKIPKKVEPGDYKVTIRLENPYIVLSKDIDLYIQGEVSPIQVNFVPPAKIEVGKKINATVYLKSLEEKIWNLEIRAYYNLGKVEVSGSEITFGGKNEVYTLPIYIEADKAGEGSVTIEVIDKETGKVLITKNFKVISIRSKAEFSKLALNEYIPYIIGAIVAIIVVLIFLMIYKKEEEERPTR